MFLMDLKVVFKISMIMIFGFNSDVEPSRRNDLNVSEKQGLGWYFLI